jgi:SSS family solute:Na+ symporter
MIKSVNILDYLVVAGYFLFMLGIGFYFMRVNKGAKEYFAGGNMIPWWVSGMTLFMASFSAWTFTGAAGFAYATGLFPLVWWGMGGFGAFIGSFLTARRWRRTRSISPVEYTYTRYNVTTQQFISWVVSVNFTLSAGVQLASTCKLLAPVMGFDIVTVTLVTGTVILLYTFVGGIWAVSVTDVVQGVILLCTTFIVVPLSLHLVGGPAKLLEALPPLTFDHVYNNVRYNEHWLVAMFVIGTIGFAGGNGQRFFSVKNEASALKVGLFSGALSLLAPVIFGVPPLVAKVIWPDLAKVDFFAPYLGNSPQDLVYIGLCLQLLPNGLIGVFLAAMLAATMSTLSAVYNMVSSIVARDMYGAIVHRRLEDREMLSIGRRASIAVGLITIGLAVLFVTSTFGIFNLMQAFFTFFNIPVIIPMAFGLIFRRVPKWSAVASVAWGLLAGVSARSLLGWDMGPQVYLALALTMGIFATSRWTGRLYEHNKGALALICVLVTAAIGTLFMNTVVHPLTEHVIPLAWLSAVAFGASLWFFARLFTRETDEDRATVKEFFRKLDTPVDVAREVFGAGKKQISIFPLVGATMLVMAGLLCLVFLTDLGGTDLLIVAALIAMMALFGAALWYFGKKSEIRSAAEYLNV